MTRTTKIILAVSAVLLVIAMVAVKLVFFPSIKDAYFAMNGRSLEQVPSGLVVVRPTHFGKSVPRESSPRPSRCRASPSGG